MGIPDRGRTTIRKTNKKHDHHFSIMRHIVHTCTSSESSPPVVVARNTNDEEDDDASFDDDEEDEEDEEAADRSGIEWSMPALPP